MDNINYTVEIYIGVSKHTPLIEKSKELKKEFFLCSVVPHKTISKRIREILPNNKIFSIKRLNFSKMFETITGAQLMKYDFEEFVTKPKVRKEKINEIAYNIVNQIKSLKEVDKKLKSLQNRINFLFKKRYN